jgi:MATE family multidrug resistance protein
LNAFAKQALVASINIASYFMVGLPAGLVLTNHYNLGLRGIWSGVVISGILKTCVETVYIFFLIDWEKECFNAAKRIRKQEHR